MNKWHEWNDWRCIGCLIENYSYSIQFRSFYVILCTPCGDLICVVTRDTTSIFENVACIWNLGAIFNCPLIIWSNLQATVCTLREPPRIYHCVCFVYQILQTKPQNTFSIIKHVAILYLTSIQVINVLCYFESCGPIYFACIRQDNYVICITVNFHGFWHYIFFQWERHWCVNISIPGSVGGYLAFNNSWLKSDNIWPNPFFQTKPYRSVTLTDWERGHYHISYLISLRLQSNGTFHTTFSCQRDYVQFQSTGLS